MKKIILLIVIVIGTTAMAQSKSGNLITLKRTKSIKLSKKGLKVAKEKLTHYLQVKEDNVYPAKGFVLYTAKTKKGNLLVAPITIGNGSKEFIKMPMPEWDLVASTSEYLVVCSCGSNISAQDGDSCEYNPNEVECSGGCTGDQSGKTCGLTTMSMTSGKIVYNHQGR
nr:hypothetical protein [uncultured Allomuricauda sp.]